MSEPNLRVPPSAIGLPAPDDLALEEDPSNPFVTREWLVTNSLGGYASGTLAGIATRRFHGLLMAALPAPLGRTMMLAHLAEVIRLPDGRAAHLGPQPGLPLDGGPLPVATLIDFRLEYGLPVWRYDALGTIVDRRVSMPHQQNTLHVSYDLASGGREVRLELEPWIRFRPHDGALDAPVTGTYALTVVDDRYEVSADGYPPLRTLVDGAPSAFTIDRKRMRDVRYHLERIRGYDSMGELHSPGFFRMPLAAGATVTLVASTEAWETIDALPPRTAGDAERERRTRLLAIAAPAAREGFAAQLVLAADQFLITPAGRSADAARAHAVGDEVRTVI
ncbi:MAG: glycogen debranching enzyme N-terminal domain-containing protein, partial [Myxococcota bacterium]|nr:glycogen debranching enzyme N-terminal domain-containing protein [Myxococcota bacterium]